MDDTGHGRPDPYDAPELAVLLGLTLTGQDPRADLAVLGPPVAWSDPPATGVVGGHGDDDRDPAPEDPTR